MECYRGTRCPYVNGGDVRHLIGERDCLSGRVDEMEKVMALSQVEIDRLRQENQHLKEEKETLGYRLKQMLGKIFKPGVKPKSGVNPPQRGAPCGHRGDSRRRPEQISEFIDIYPDQCDHCGGQIKTYEKIFDEHVVEDIEIKKKVTCYRLHYGYCQQCQKPVYAKTKAPIMPGDRIGVQVRAVGSYLRYIGVPYRKAARIFQNVFGINLTHPSFLAFNREQAQNGVAIYEGIKESIRHSACVNGDETGWRVNGQNHWLWVFTNKDAALYQIDKSRGSQVVGNILGEHYQGTLTSDFYSAYNKLQTSAKQRCLGHLLAEIKKVQEKNRFPPDSIDGIFCQELKTVLKQTIEVWHEYHEGTMVYADLAQEKERAISRMMELMLLPLGSKDTRRVRKRIIKHNQELFTFLDNPLVEPTNNRAERQLRPYVIMRKITLGNRSALGASNQAVMMSIIQTGILNGIEPLDIFRSLSAKPLTSFTELPQIRSP